MKEITIYKRRNINDEFGFDKSLLLDDYKNPFPKTFTLKDCKQEDKICFIKINKGTEIFYNYIQNELQFSYNEKLSFFKNLETIYKFWEVEKNSITAIQLVGDLGEVIFIKKLIENNIKWENIYQNTDSEYNELFDFSLNENAFIDVKTTTRFKKEINIDFRQLPCFNENKKIYYVSVLIDKVSSGKTIIDLIKEIGIGKSKHLDSLYEKYKGEKHLIKQYTYSIDNSVELINDDIIPTLEFKNKGNFKNGKIVVSLSSSDSFNKLENLINILKN